MARRRTSLPPVIDPARYGVSFSLKQCRNFGLDPHETLQWLLDQGWRRFRLMSYWDLHEPVQGSYDFAELDRQIAQIAKAGGMISLCLGVKQPRWPEYHWPNWVLAFSEMQRQEALLKYVEAVVERYKGRPEIVSWQLENEALLRNFGEHIHIDRQRLRAEYRLVKDSDPGRPIIMSTSNGWGIPLRLPIPGAVGFSFYTIMYKNGHYHHTVQQPWLHRLRAAVVRRIFDRQVFIHELQCEPWGPAAIWKMTAEEQARSMNPEQLRSNIEAARSVGVHPIDLWGAEWWYWRYQQGDTSIWDAVRSSLD